MPLLAWVRGRRAERRAARALRRAGLEVLAMNLRAGGGEIDILAREGEVVAVVEVRERAEGLLAADLSVDAAKRRQVQRCWSAIARRYRLPRGLAVRFDLVLLDGAGGLRHLRGLG